VTHPAIRDLFQSLSRDPAFQEIVTRLIRNPSAHVSLSGLTTTAKALYLVLLWQATERNLMVVVDGNKQAEALAELVDTSTCCQRSACRHTVRSASSAPSGFGGWHRVRRPSLLRRWLLHCFAPSRRSFTGS
jgi:hypothetical protein